MSSVNQVSGFRFQVSGGGGQGSGFRVQGSGAGARGGDVVSATSSPVFPPRHPTLDTRHFTLIELLAAISIIAVLAALIVGAASMASRKAATSKTVSMLKQMELALEQYYQDRGFYPQSTTAAVLAWDITGFKSTTGKPYLENYRGRDGAGNSLWKDAWNMPFFYECPGTMNPEKYDLWSRGPDRMHGKAGANPVDSQCTAADMSDDIASWKRNE